ncbi:mechanosensitive ion channel family protein [Rubritalea marina]|uniref:mechanosensitive ion channel family protein n=1 Tax=Rubritalea marina TaxID=361055 RepID=UPI00037A44B5|nr:mechanosensitive ion channel family protein [Rubritalea marina]
MRYLKPISIICAILFSSMLGYAEQKQVVGQDQSQAQAHKAAVAEVVLEPNTTVNLRQLVTQLRPLRKAELEKLLSEWVSQLEKQVTITADYSFRIDSGALSEEDRKKFIQLEQESHTQEFEIAKRAKLVMGSLEAKGGDIKEAQAYINATTDISSDLDPSGRMEYLYTLALNWMKDPDGGIVFLGRVLGAILLIVVFWGAGIVVRLLVKRAISKRRSVSRILKDFLIRSVSWVVLLFGMMFALSSLGVSIGPMLTAMGAGGFIIGFALQETLGNFASGMMIMIYQPFDEGDFVEISGISGKVEKMSLVSTTLLTFDNKELIIPNKKAWGQTIINYSSREVRRVDMIFSISYSDDAKKACEVLKEMAAEHPLVLENPLTVVGVHALADSSVNLFLRPWAKTEDYWEVHYDLMHKAKILLEGAGMTIPFPQQDMHIIYENQPALQPPEPNEKD